VPAAVAAAIQAPLRLAQQVAQYHGVIAARIVRGVQQRHALLRSACRESIGVESAPAKVQTWVNRGVSGQ